MTADTRPFAPFEWMLALRYLRAKRAESFISVISMISLVGIALGVAAPAVGSKLAPISNIFLRLIKSIIAPLIFGTLVYGIAGAGSLKAMGRIGLKAVIYFEAVTTVALFTAFRPKIGRAHV